MSLSIADVFEDYIESKQKATETVLGGSIINTSELGLQNLPFEIDQNMQELRRMDDDLQKCRETYTKNKKNYVKQSRLPNSNNLVPARSQLDKEFKTAMQKQDQKIELAMKMYDLVSRHIERLDSQVLKTGMSESDWVRSAVVRKGPISNRKRHISSSLSDRSRKRTLHSSRLGLPLETNLGTVNDSDIETNEPLYCYCNQVSFGDMVACDSENCEREWFHYPCVGLVEPPAGKWYCEDCKPEQYDYNDNSSDQSTSSSSDEDD